MKRLTQQDADDIKSFYLNGSQSMTQIARMFKTSPTTVAKIIDNKWTPFVPKSERTNYASQEKTSTQEA